MCDMMRGGGSQTGGGNKVLSAEKPPATLTLTHSQTNTHTHTNSHQHSHILKLTLTLIITLIHTHTNTHTQTTSHLFSHSHIPTLYSNMHIHTGIPQPHNHTFLTMHIRSFSLTLIIINSKQDDYHLRLSLGSWWQGVESIPCCSEVTRH